MSSPILFIFGAQSTALEIAELAGKLHPDWRLMHVVGSGQSTDADNTLSVEDLGSFVTGHSGPAYGILSMADMGMREERLGVMREHGIEPVSLIHPDATVSPSAVIGEGSYIAAGARVSVNAQVGAHSMLNLNVTFGHDAVCGEHCVINPGAAISGNVTIGDRVLVGANSFIFQGLDVGDDCQVDAMTYAWRNMPARHVASSRSMKLLPRVDIVNGRDKGD